MSWRTVIIENRSKLDLKYNNIIVRQAEKTYSICINEINTLILESTAISLTCALLCELVKNKVNIVFCDEKSNPFFQAISFYGSHDSHAKIITQFNWDNFFKQKLWTLIIYEKIEKQKNFLKELNKKEYLLLEKYQQELELNDSTNREAHSAKVYFNALFSKDFSRKYDNVTNKALNYGYHIIASLINKEIISNGYLTQIGIFHCNQFNHFNFSYDLIEPLRIIVDKFVYTKNFDSFETSEKKQMFSLLNLKFKIEDKNYFLHDMIKIYVKSIIDSLNFSDLNKVKFYNEL